jgi:hypothetical protein
MCQRIAHRPRPHPRFALLQLARRVRQGRVRSLGNTPHQAALFRPRDKALLHRARQRLRLTLFRLASSVSEIGGRDGASLSSDGPLDHAPL